MPTALIALDFDPLLHLVAGLVVRWEAVAIAAVIVAALVVAGLMARRASLRNDDLIFIAVGVVPGAVIGGRSFLPGGGITLGGDSGTNAMQVYRPTMTCQ